MRPAAGLRTGRIAAFVVLVALLLIVRGPLHFLSFSLPLSNDDAIPLLMARHVLRGEFTTTWWAQPYNGTLDSYLLAGGLLFGPPKIVFRCYQTVCGLLVVLVVFVLAARLRGETAGWAAAFLASVASPYVALTGCLGRIPHLLVPILVVAFALPALAESPSALALGLGGVLSGLAVWNSSLAVPPILGMAAGLALSGRRARRWLGFPFGLAIGLVPLALSMTTGAVRPSRIYALRPPAEWMEGLANLGHALGTLLGFAVPLRFDGPGLNLPIPFQLALLTGLFALLIGGASKRALPLIGWALAVAASFVLGGRARGNTARYLFPLVVPVLVLAGAGAARLWERSRMLALGAGLLVVTPWCYAERVFLRSTHFGSASETFWQVPSLDATITRLKGEGISSVYSSSQFADRLTLESGEEVIASQPWNERFPGYPLRFRDEVDADPRVAWVLSRFHVPLARDFKASLQTMDGQWEEEPSGELAIFWRFVPPYDETRPVPNDAISILSSEGESLTRLLGVSPTWTSGGDTLLSLGVRPARSLSALVISLEPGISAPGTRWSCDVGGPVVARGRRGPAPQWLTGAPRGGNQPALVVPLHGERSAEVRLRLQGAPLSVSRVFLYGPDEPSLASTGRAAAEAALACARRGDWERAARLYEEAGRLEPHRASYQIALARSRWRASRRTWLDVRSLDEVEGASSDQRRDGRPGAQITTERAAWP